MPLGILAVLVVVAPLPHGGVLPGGAALLQVLAFLAAATSFLASGRRLGAFRLPAAAVLGVTLLGVAQVLPAPAFVVRALAPGSLAAHAEGAEVLSLFGRSPAEAPRLSVTPFETRRAALDVLAVLAAFVAAHRVGTSRYARRILVAAVIVSGLVQSLLAVLGHREEERLHGSFVNPNHLAGFLHAPAILSLGVALVSLVRRNREGGEADLADRLARRLPGIAAGIFLFAVLAGALGLTKSRGGILAQALAIGVFVGVTFLLHRRGVRTRFAMRLSLAVGAGLLLVAIATRTEPVLRLLSSDPRDLGRDTRLEIWRVSLDAFRAQPVAGWGLGTFPEAFRRYQGRELRLFVEQAHNDGLQLLVTGGAVGLFLGALAAGSMLVRLLVGAVRQPRREEKVLAIAGSVSLLALLVHGLVEFNFSIPALPVVLAVTLGAAAAATADEEADAGSRVTESPSIRPVPATT